MGIPGVEYFAHPWVLGPRFAREVLFTGARFSAERAYQVGMVSRVVPRASLEPAVFELAGQIAGMPRFGLALAKRAINQCEDLLGHHALPGPVAESLAAVPTLLAALADARPASRGPDGSCGKWLAGLASGELIATLAAPPGVPLAASAEVAGLVLYATDGVVGRGSVDATFRSVDPSRSLAEVRRGPVLADGVAGAVARALDFGALACAAQLLGAGRALLEASVRHGRLRVQFGRPVGAFQAVKHRLADVGIGLEFARPLADYRAARAALQVHGAIGYTAEHDLSRFLLQVRALVPAWGTAAEHRARILAELR